jgi:hypothetical protein
VNGGDKMKKKLSLLALAFASAAMPTGYAAPKISGSKKIYGRKLQEESSAELISSLLFSTNGSEQNVDKNFRAESGDLEIGCHREENLTSVCEVKIRTTENKPQAMIYGEDAHLLFDALVRPVFSHTISDVKVFTDRNEELSIYCNKSLIPDTEPYACSVELAI